MHRIGQARLRVVFVHQRDVIEHVLLLDQHLADAGIDDDGQLARERRVVGLAVGDGRGDQVAGPVLVLQPFAAERGAPGRRSQQEAARALIGGRPDLVAHALKTEHRVVDVERQHRQPVHAVAGGCGGPAGQRAGLADAFFQDLAIGGFAVTQDGVDVFGRVALADAGIDADLLEQIGHAEGARLVRHDGHHARAERLVFQERAQHADEGHRGAHLLAIGCQRELGVAPQGRHGHHVAGRLAPWHGTAEGFAVGVQVAHFDTVIGRLVERQRGGLLVAERQIEAVAKADQVGVLELLVRVRGHLALTGAHAVALLGVRQDDRWLADVRRRCRIGRVDLHQIVAAALQAIDLFVGHALRQPFQFLVLTEEGVAVEASVLGREGLHLAVDRVGEGPRQRAGAVTGKQAVPVAAPDQLDDVPAGAGEQLFKLVDDAAVAPYRAVEPLQVAVDDPHQVVELLARGQRQRAHGFGLVHLAVAEHAPHFSSVAIEQLAVGQVAHEARVVDRADRADAHRAGRKLPEVGHQVRMRVAAQAPGASACCEGRRGKFLAVVQQIVFAQAPFEVGTGIDAGRTVRLKKHQVAPMALAFGVEEVVEAHLEQVGRAGVAGDVAAEFAVRMVGAHHHRQRVPAHQGGDALLDRQITRKRGLVIDGDGVDIGRAQLGLPTDAPDAGLRGKSVEDLPGARGAVGGDQCGEGVTPFGCFLRVGVAGVGGAGERQQMRGGEGVHTTL